MMPFTVPGARIAMRVAIHPPCEVPGRTPRGCERVEDLQVGDGRVPVGELLVRGAGLAVAVRLDGEQVGGRGERLVRELGPVLLDGVVNELTMTSVGSEAS